VENNADGNENGTGEGNAAEKTVSLKALQEEREARKALRAELDAFKAEREAAKLKAAEEAGEHKRLYDEIAPKYAEVSDQLTKLQERETARIERAKERNTTRAEALPEEYRALVPAGLSVDETAAQIERLEALAQNADTRAKGGRGSNGGSKPDADAIPEAILAEVTAEASRHNRDPKAWFKAHKKRLLRKHRALLT